MKQLIYLVLLLFSSNTFAISQDDLLRPDEAFKIAEPTYDSSGNLRASWTIADDYYLYKKTFKFKSDTANVEFGEPIYPAAEKYHDITEGKKVDIYTKLVDIDVPVKTTDGSDLPANLDVEVTHQGCAKVGVCYPPKKTKFTLALQEGGVAPVLTGIPAEAPAAAAASDSSSASASPKSLIEKMGLGGGSNKAIPVEEAYQLQLLSDGEKNITAQFNITPGHYIYKEKIKFELKDAGDNKIGEITYPPAVMKNDPAYGEIDVYETDTTLSLPLSAKPEDGAKIYVEYQGCSELTGICYPPVKVTEPIATLASFNSAQSAETTSAGTTTTAAATQTEQDQFADKIRNSSFFLTIFIFFIAGVGLALTPCVFPMIPILSGIIAGQSGYLSVSRAFLLSLAYVLPMALTYAIVGVIAGLSGVNLQIVFQDPWVIGTFALVFVVLSLSMFGFYELQMPSSIQSKLTEISNRQEGGSFIGAGIMGVLSAIIVGPCVTAPLIGALIYIAQTQDAVLGGFALFALGMGMGLPLLIIGTAAGKLLPRAGVWMDTTKAIFGVMMLGLAIWMLDRVVPSEVTLLLTAILLIVSSMYTGALDKITEETTNFGRLFKGFGIVMLIAGIAMLIGVAFGGSSITKPLKGVLGTSGIVAGSTTVASSDAKVPFNMVKGVSGLNTALETGGKNQQISMLDFYADWCVSCQEWENITFKDAQVIASLSSMHTLKTDVTADDAIDKELMKKFGLFGPPAILFFTSDGQELKNYRLVGYYPPKQFLEHIDKVRAAAGA